MKVAMINDFKITAIEDNVDASYIELNSRHHQLILDITGFEPSPEVGWDFNGNRIVIPDGYSIPMKITKLAMRNRFTSTELVAIYTAANTNVMFKIFIDNLAVATFIDLSRPDTVAAMGILQSVGILTSQRVSDILNTPPTSLEIYKG